MFEKWKERRRKRKLLKRYAETPVNSDFFETIRLPMVKNINPILLSDQIVGMTPDDIENMGKNSKIRREIKQDINKILEILDNE